VYPLENLNNKWHNVTCIPFKNNVISFWKFLLHILVQDPMVKHANETSLKFFALYNSNDNFEEFLMKNNLGTLGIKSCIGLNVGHLKAHETIICLQPSIKMKSLYWQYRNKMKFK